MKKLFFLLFVCALCCCSCNSCQKKNQVATPELTKEQKRTVRNVDITIHRYEKRLFALDTTNIADGVKSLYGQYPENLVAKNCWNNASMMAALKGYISDPIIREIYKETQKQFPDMKDIEKELEEAFKIYLTHFPDDSVPGFYTLIPGLDFSMPSVFGFDNNLFICLDMYLGADYKHYAAAGMPRFIARRCTPDRIAMDCFSKGQVYKHLPEKTLVTLLDNIIDAGKKMFFTQVMFPEKKEIDILGYTEEQYEWAVKYQGQVWQYLIEKNLLYSKNEDDIRRMIDETPFTREFGNQSPGRIGAFIGLQIVKNYMQNHTDVTLTSLMQNSDAQSIMKQSGFKPKF